VLLAEHGLADLGGLFRERDSGSVFPFAVKFDGVDAESFRLLKLSLIVGGTGCVLLGVEDRPMSILGSVVRFAVELLGDSMLTLAEVDDGLLIFLESRDLSERGESSEQFFVRRPEDGFFESVDLFKESGGFVELPRVADFYRLFPKLIPL